MNSSKIRYDRIAFLASPAAEAVEARERLVDRYSDVGPEHADVIVALGGDGFMLQTLHQFMNSGIPIYGMHRGTVGFLMNEFHENHLIERLQSAHRTLFHPLLMRTTDFHRT